MYKKTAYTIIIASTLFLSIKELFRNLSFRLFFFETVYNSIISKSKLEYPPISSQQFPFIEYITFKSIGLGIDVNKLYYPTIIPEGEHTPDKNRLARIIRDYVTVMVPRSIPGSAGVPQDDVEAIKRVISPKRLKLLNKDFPIRPHCFKSDGTIDLKHLFLHSPFIDTIADVTHCCSETNHYTIDLSWLSDYSVQDGLVDLSCIVYLNEHFEPYQIDTFDGSKQVQNSCTLGDTNWEYSKKIVCCSLLNVSTLKHHFTYSHHSIPNNVAIAAYKCLPPDHYLRRMLYPHIYKTLNTNRALGPTLFVPNGVIENIFAYDAKTCWSILDRVQDNFDINEVDPRVYLNNVPNSDTKSNLLGLYDIIFNYVNDYLKPYETNIFDPYVQEFVANLKTYVWNTEYDFTTLKRILSICIWTGSVRHSFISGNIWDYAAWVHYMPTRLYSNHQPMPVDRFQQAMNTLSVANIPSHELAFNYSYLAVNKNDEHVMNEFYNNLKVHDYKYQQLIKNGTIQKCEVVLASEIGASTAT